jgi:hypothetical protein
MVETVLQLRVGVKLHSLAAVDVLMQAKLSEQVLSVWVSLQGPSPSRFGAFGELTPTFNIGDSVQEELKD